MSDVNWRLLMRRRDHTFQSPVPGDDGGLRRAERLHDLPRRQDARVGGRTDGRLVGRRRRGGRRASSLATTMYAAGTGDATTVPALATLAVDRSQGAVIRASALEYIARLAGARGARRVARGQPDVDRARPSGASARARATGSVEPRVFGALLGAASDPEPMVRADAVRTLGALDQRDERVLAVLMARVVDETRVVRARAAESLLALDVVTAPGRAGEALARAQQDLADEPARRSRSRRRCRRRWPGCTRSVARTPRPSRAVAAALALDPSAARPYVIRGVLAARAGRFADAIASWKAARDRDPATPNIDRMIDEATRRLHASPNRKPAAP